jgi:hypothetical protein
MEESKMPESPLFSASTERLERRIRLAATLVGLGLLVLLLTLMRIHPLAFVAYAIVACPLVLAGMLLFLYSIVSEEAGTS